MNEIFFPSCANWLHVERWLELRGIKRWSVCPTWAHGCLINMVRYDLPN